MKLLAKLKIGGALDKDGENALLFTTAADISRLKTGKQYCLMIQEEGRSLNQNSLYWMLVNQIANVQSVKPAEVHNKLLRDVRIPWLDADGECQGICLRDDSLWMERMDIHVAPTSQLTERIYYDKNGKMVSKVYRWFLLLLPSHLMDKEEFGRLLDSAIQEAEANGIHTEPEAIKKAKENTNE